MEWLISKDVTVFKPKIEWNWFGQRFSFFLWIKICSGKYFNRLTIGKILGLPFLRLGAKRAGHHCGPPTFFRIFCIICMFEMNSKGWYLCTFIERKCWDVRPAVDIFDGNNVDMIIFSS